jgi:hypothetical protein
LVPYPSTFGVIPSLQHPKWVPAQPPSFFLEGLGSGPGHCGSCSQSAIDVYMPFGSLWQDGLMPGAIGVHE